MHTRRCASTLVHILHVCELPPHSQVADLTGWHKSNKEKAEAFIKNPIVARTTYALPKNPHPGIQIYTNTADGLSVLFGKFSLVSQSTLTSLQSGTVSGALNHCLVYFGTYASTGCFQTKSTSTAFPMLTEKTLLGYVHLSSMSCPVVSTIQLCTPLLQRANSLPQKILTTQSGLGLSYGRLVWSLSSHLGHSSCIPPPSYITSISTSKVCPCSLKFGFDAL